MNAGDHKDVRRAEKDSKRRIEEDHETLRAVCASPAGRRWLWDTLSDARVFTTTFSVDPYSTAFNEGVRSSGLRLLNQITEHCPEQFILMMREHNDRTHSARADNTDRAHDSDDSPDYSAG